ncbi:MAG: hypothetical protein U0V74_04640 [Chitinophagales bacterium]
MKAATVNELKEELKHLPAGKLVELCSRLARFKKENKELLTYLLFEAHDEEAYVLSVKAEIEEGFAQIPIGNSLYLQKKSLRKILRAVNKYIRYSGIRTTEAELLLYFCEQLCNSSIAWRNSPVLVNMYNTQRKKVNSAIASFHEDLQYDFERRIKELTKTV